MLNALSALLSQEEGRFGFLFLAMINLLLWTTNGGALISGIGFIFALVWTFRSDIVEDWHRLMFSRELSSLGA